MPLTIETNLDSAQANSQISNPTNYNGPGEGAAFIGAGAGALIGGPLGALAGWQLGSAAQNDYKNQQAYKESVKKGEEALDRQIALQKEFAQNGLSWKIQDAKRSGISALAALGATGSNFQPMSQTVTAPPESQFQSAGQDIAKAMFMNQLQMMQAEAQTTGTALDNELKLAQIGKLKAETQKLGTRIPTQGAINPNLDQYATKTPDATVTWFPQPNNRVIAMPSQAATEALENDLPGRMTFQSERVLGQYNPNVAKSGAILPKGYDYWERDGAFMWKAAKFKNKEDAFDFLKKHQVKNPNDFVGPQYHTEYVGKRIRRKPWETQDRVEFQKVERPGR